ncbi:MAG: GNAT family N-acetyltransferase [Candidatus Odinarchaeota archaeon]
MTEVVISEAAKEDRKQLLDWFEHYSIKELVKNRVDCYLMHNFTVVAKKTSKIVGVLQWYIKEDPKSGIGEIEELFVLEEYRGRGIGLQLVKFTVQSIISHFERINIKPRKVFAFVSKENKVAKLAFERNGFKPVSRIDGLFSDSEEVLLYLLDLSSESCQK